MNRAKNLTTLITEELYILNRIVSTDGKTDYTGIILYCKVTIVNYALSTYSKFLLNF